MESLDNQEIGETKKGKKNLTGFLVGTICTAIALGGVGIIDSVNNYNQVAREAHKFVSILDKNKDGILDAKEIKKFYDVTGLNPYTTPLNTISRKQWNSFLKNYK